MLVRHPLTEEHKRAICAWDYPREYALYNLPPYEEMQEKQQGFCHPERGANFHGFSEGETLVGFVNLREEETEVFVGIGVNPVLCGKGYGQEILRQIRGMSQSFHPGKRMYLQVRTWNRRAIRCYEKAGFRIDGEAFEQVTGSGKGIFYRMILE